jgi:hypothetical protein
MSAHKEDDSSSKAWDTRPPVPIQDRVECFVSQIRLRAKGCKLRNSSQTCFWHTSLRSYMSVTGVGCSPRLVQQASAHKQPVGRELMSIPLASGAASSVFSLSKCVSTGFSPCARHDMELSHSVAIKGV